MLFSSILFLVWFLPLTFLVYFCVPKAFRNFVLLAASLIFYGWSSPWWLLLIGADCLIGYACGRFMENGSPSVRRAALIVGIVLSGALLFWFKYAMFFSRQLSALTGLDLVLKGIALPAGISFYTFQVISYLADVYTHKAPAQHSFLRFALYVCMFFQLIAGPIVRYSQIEGELETRRIDAKKQSDGARRFVCGLSKKVLIANPLSALNQFIVTQAEPAIALFWLNAFAVSLLIYYDFSGYSDMAIGLGAMMGFHLPENFRYPFQAGTISEFWRRWHMSLTAWFRDYVYIPLGGSRKGKGRQFFNLFVVWMFTGLWHGAAWNFILWGLFFWVWISLEKFLLPESVLHTWSYGLLCRLGILISFLLFYAPTLFDFASQIQAMFGAGALPVWTAQTGYVFQNACLLMAAALIGATSLPHRLFVKYQPYRIVQILCWCAVAFGLIFCLASLSAGTWNPFLYFQF